MFVVDTNILVYAADKDSPFQASCKERLEEWRRQSTAWYLTWGIVYDFLRITTHPRVFRRPFSVGQAWAFVEALLTSPSLGFLVPTERHRTVLSQVLAQAPLLSGNILHDARTAVLMKEHGIVLIYTRDTDFHRFSFLQPLDPTV